jgi:hypothetical protein
VLTSFDPIGFWLPACVAAIYLPRAIRAARAFDWALVFINLREKHRPSGR